jgi:alpha-amylase/alpha-mannosidase (GH57 family)
MNRYLCIHGHFYQPPRENPWLEAVELQDSAYPYHDWNARITAECYAPNAAARILDPERKIIDIVNNYSRISFNFGPTLLSWLERQQPDTYQAILAADQSSRQLFAGHGSALAQAYNHMILPLASSRDKKTQIRWGIRDFEHRFRRQPEGLWLPETAVDLEVLEVLVDHGILFTICAPRQAARVRKINAREWQDVSNARINPRMPYLCRLPSGRSIVLFFYDGPIAQDIAFGGLLESGERFAKRLMAAFANDDSRPQLVHIATDGETYGHHQRHGDMALAYCLHLIESRHLARITVFGEYLEKHRPTHEVEIFERSSWSCIHGVERWRAACGCHTGGHPEWHQKWRAPLRGALDWLRDNLAQIYEDCLSPLVPNPWQARDAYIDLILDRTPDRAESFLARQSGRQLSAAEKTRALKLLEMQRHALLMYTSCGWFFDEVSGIENVQILQYAARAIQLAQEVGHIALEQAFLRLLEHAPSNIPELKNGASVYLRFVKPAELDLLRVAEHYALSSLFTESPETVNLYAYSAESLAYERLAIGRQKMAVGTVAIRSAITAEQEEVSFAVLHLGDHNLSGAAGSGFGEQAFSDISAALQSRFRKGEISEVIRIMNTCFNGHSFSLWHLFKDEQRDILNQLFAATHQEIELSFRQIYDHYYPLMQVVEGLGLTLPRHFAVILECIVNDGITSLLQRDGSGSAELKRLIEEATRWHLPLDRPRFSLLASNRINSSMQALAATADGAAVMEEVVQLLQTITVLDLHLDLWQAQNIYLAIGRDRLSSKSLAAAQEDEDARHWVSAFERLGEYLRVRLD